MSEKRIKEIINTIEPDAGAKERMYQNILKKAQQQNVRAETHSQHNKRSTRFIRYALPIAACFCLLVIGITRFLPGDTPITPEESMVQGGNPFTEVDNADAFKKLSITLDAPSKAQEISYAVIDGEIAEVRFELDGRTFLARASALDGDFSGLNGQELSSETIDAKTNAVLVTIDTGIEKYHKIIWTNGKVNYCLYGTDGADKNQVLAAYEALKK